MTLKKKKKKNKDSRFEIQVSAKMLEKERKDFFFLSEEVK